MQFLEASQTAYRLVSREKEKPSHNSIIHDAMRNFSYVGLSKALFLVVRCVWCRLVVCSLVQVVQAQALALQVRQVRHILQVQALGKKINGRASKRNT